MAYRPTTATLAAKAERARVIQGAAHSLVAESGFAAASVKAIAARAGVSVGTVYTYFANLDDLLAAVFRTAAGVELEHVRAAVKDARDGEAGARASRQLAALVETFAGRAIRGRTLAWALLVEPVSPLIDTERLTFRRAYADLVEDTLAGGIESGELRPHDPRIAGPGIVGMISEALTGPLSPLDRHTITDTDVTRGLTDLCLRAVKGDHS